MDERTIARFWSHVDTSAGPDRCWLWTADLRRRGYGRFSVSSKTMQAHRVVFELANGPIPANEDRYGTMCVCHRCDNRACVNPSHLFLGTHQDNMSDKVAKGRQARCIGEENPQAKLTGATVANLRADRSAGMSQRKLAARYGISQAQVRNIIGGKHWAHV